MIIIKNASNPKGIILNIDHLVWCKQYQNCISVFLEDDSVSQVIEFDNNEKAEEKFQEIIENLKNEEIDF